MLGNLGKFLIFVFPLAGVAKWQTRWTQNPVDLKSVWVRVPPPAQKKKPILKYRFFSFIYFRFTDLSSIHHTLSVIIAHLPMRVFSNWDCVAKRRDDRWQEEIHRDNSSLFL